MKKIHLSFCKTAHEKINTRFVIFIVFFLLFACNNQETQPIVVPSHTSKPSVAISPSLSPAKIILTKTPTKVFLPAAIQTLSFPPYPTKQLILDYNVIGWHTSFDFISDWSLSSLVLYSDGQMIIPGKIYRQKMLSTEEISLFFAQLEAKGFYSIETNQKHDPTDHLYEFGDQYQRVQDGLYYCVLVNKGDMQDVCAREPFFKFLVPEMKSTLKFLDEYQPKDMTPYQPDRILLSIEAGRPSYYLEGSLPAEAIPWQEGLPSLETATHKILYAEKEEAKEIFALFDNKVSIKVFNQNGKEYTVEIKIILPHQILSQL